jgi:hypothetical protein
VQAPGDGTAIVESLFTCYELTFHVAENTAGWGIIGPPIGTTDAIDSGLVTYEMNPCAFAVCSVRCDIDLMTMFDSNHWIHWVFLLQYAWCVYQACLLYVGRQFAESLL